MEFELNRVGILNSGIFEWHKTFDSDWYSYLFNKLKEEKKCFCQNVNELKCTFAHYSCIKKSILNNHNRILILEDDERFLKNIDEIESILSNIPNDGDVILFDYSSMYKNLINEYRAQKINDYFSSFDKLNNAGCYMLSNKALNVFQQLYDNLILPADNYFHRFDYKKLNLNKYFSIKNMAC
jgi:GR25 family glycosyltransferase involved in LPS biosynthesis